MPKSVLVAIALLVLSSGASAQEFGRAGPYLAVAGVIGIEDFDIPSGPGGTGDTVRGGVDARVGYRAHPRLAAEINYEWLDGFDLTFAGSEFTKLDIWMLTANVKGYALTGQFQPYLLVGSGVLHAEAEGIGDTDYTWKFGAGIDLYAFSDAPKAHWVLFFEGSYLLPTGDVDDVNLWNSTIGVKYRF